MPRPASPIQNRLLNTDAEDLSNEHPFMQPQTNNKIAAVLDKIPYWKDLPSLHKKLAAAGVIALFLFLLFYHSSSSHSCPVRTPVASPTSITPAESYPAHILITGGAGYIGSHMALLLYEQTSHPYHIIIIDDLSRGNIRNIQTLQSLSRDNWSLTFYEHDCGDTSFMTNIMQTHHIELVIHFAGYAYASESVAKPLLYFDNIVTKTQGLLAAMQAASVSKLVYSSSSATYGQPLDEECDVPINEASPQMPVSPYGRSKLMAEQVISAYQISQHKANFPFSYAALRYFNVIGADPQTRIGALPKKELKAYSRVVDACFDAVVEDKEMNIYGYDYDTPDHTAIRDYIHVWDLVKAHLLVIGAVHDDCAIPYNVGIGHGFSNKELAAACSAATGKQVKTVFKQRREGDPALVLGDATKIKKELLWVPEYTDLTEAIATAWGWRQKVEAEGENQPTESINHDPQYDGVEVESEAPAIQPPPTSRINKKKNNKKKKNDMDGMDHEHDHDHD